MVDNKEIVLQHNLNWLYHIHVSDAELIDAELSGDLKTNDIATWN